MCLLYVFRNKSKDVAKIEWKSNMPKCSQTRSVAWDRFPALIRVQLSPIKILSHFWPENTSVKVACESRSTDQECDSNSDLCMLTRLRQAPALVSSNPHELYKLGKKVKRNLSDVNRGSFIWIASVSHLVSLSKSHNGGFVSLRKKKEKRENETWRWVGNCRKVRSR